MNPEKVNEALAIRNAVARIIRTAAGGYEGKINIDAARGLAERLLEAGIIDTFAVAVSVERETKEEA